MHLRLNSSHWKSLSVRLTVADTQSLSLFILQRTPQRMCYTYFTSDYVISVTTLFFEQTTYLLNSSFQSYVDNTYLLRITYNKYSWCDSECYVRLGLLPSFTSLCLLQVHLLLHFIQPNLTDPHVIHESYLTRAWADPHSKAFHFGSV